ncbi:MAG: UDP-N-acetylmuramate dehydrogenase [Anaerolineae bacterium]|nr:UDP-N-acetylmuramate dehydrogenase [Anaerolineae bacterium]
MPAAAGTWTEALATIAEALPGVAQLNAPLAPHAWVGVGGPADLLVIAEQRDDLVRAIRLALAHDVPWRVYGGLTNILVPDAGLRGMIVLNHARDVRFADDYRLETDAGAIVVKVAREAVRRGWGGLTWAVGLPGTIGGAVVNNAGAFGGEISRVLQSADVLSADGAVQRVPVDWFDFRYRCSKLKGAGQSWLVLGATFQLRPGNAAHLEEKAVEYTARRTRTQPPGRTLGSTFKNPPGDYAGRLIEAAGLKGTRVGGIKVSEHHANFFINDGNGTAADFRTLLARVQQVVEAVYGIHLEPEIEILPEPSERAWVTESQ